MTVDPTTCLRTLRLKVKSEAYPWLDATMIGTRKLDWYQAAEAHVPKP
jgi:hypothetical protein